MNVRVILSVLIIVMVLGCNSLVAAQAFRGTPQAGQVVYEKNLCHCEKLDGAGPEGQYLIIQPTNLQAITSRAKAGWELLITISHGAAFTSPHAWVPGEPDRPRA
jgi:hypothetical protein